MQLDSIIDLLGIKDSHVHVFDRGEEKNGYWFELYTSVRTQTCPSCGAKTKRVHDYKKGQKIQGDRIAGKSVTLYLTKRRYKCVACPRTFFEKLSFLDKYQRHTTMLEQEILGLCTEMSFQSAARIKGIRSNQCLRMFDKRQITVKKVLPRAIAIDEFKGDAGGERFQTKIVDVENREIIDILPDRRAETIEEYIRGCDYGNVEIVVMDLSQAFKKAVRQALGNPLIIADRFHFMRQVYWAFDEVRRGVQHDLWKNQRIQMKRSKELLWKSREKLNDKGKERVEEVLEGHDELRKAYELKNTLDCWFKASDSETAQAGLEAWIALVEDAQIPSFQKVTKTFKRWKQEILQSFMYPFNNGYIEGVNNTTKVIKRMSYGIKSFERLRKKILWRQAINIQAG